MELWIVSNEESAWAIVGRQYAQALQRRTDEKFYGTCALEANHSGQHRMYIY